MHIAAIEILSLSFTNDSQYSLCGGLNKLCLNILYFYSMDNLKPVISFPHLPLYLVSLARLKE